MIVPDARCLTFDGPYCWYTATVFPHVVYGTVLPRKANTRLIQPSSPSKPILRVSLVTASPHFRSARQTRRWATCRMALAKLTLRLYKLSIRDLEAFLGQLLFIVESGRRNVSTLKIWTMQIATRAVMRGAEWVHLCAATLSE